MDNKCLGFDYSDKEREQTILALIADSKTERMAVEAKWRLLKGYWCGFGQALEKYLDKFGDDTDMTDVLTQFEEVSSSLSLTDAYIQVESQITPEPPEPMFQGRDNKEDSDKAKQRQYIVEYTMYKNDVKSQNTEHERTMRMLGDSFYKVYYDDNKSYDDNHEGEICIDFVNVDDIFPDPTADCIDNCEYINHIYYMHRRKAQRLWKKDFKKEKINVYEIASASRSTTQVTSDNTENGASSEINLVQITEHWYRDDDGDICVSMFVGDKEFRNVKKYWSKTKSQNKNFPFVHFYRIKNLSSFWNMSELEEIIPLINQANRILNTSIDNMELTSNDMLIYEENSLADGEEITNEPGAAIKTKPGMVNSVKRLGGLNALANFVGDIQFLQGEIQRTARNYDSNQGKETERVTTASGLAQLRADASEQSNIKDYDLQQAWKRLFILVDWTALEFYDDDRLIYIGVPQVEKEQQQGLPMNLDKKQGNVFFRFNSDKMRKVKGDKQVPVEGEEVEYYYPLIDCEVNVTSGVQKSKSFTIQVLQSLMGQPITPDNYKTAIKLIQELDIPQKDDIIDEWKEMFNPQPIEGMDNAIQAQLSPQTQQMARKNPQLMEKAKSMMSEQSQSNITAGDRSQQV